MRYVEGHFVESYYPTIENTFSHEIQYKGQTFLTEIIDTQGQVGTPGEAAEELQLKYYTGRIQHA